MFLLCRVFVPIRNYRFSPKFVNMDDQFLVEYSIHDTFDALSPKYDKPIGKKYGKNCKSEVEKRI